MKQLSLFDDFNLKKVKSKNEIPSAKICTAMHDDDNDKVFIYKIKPTYERVMVCDNRKYGNDKLIFNNLLKEKFNPRQEIFFLIGLDLNNRKMIFEEIFKGTLNQTLTHPREIFHSLIISNSAGFIVAHNHPSGEVTPSKQDYEVTDRLFRAGQIMGINLMDHIIFTDKKFYSFQRTGYFRDRGL